MSDSDEEADSAGVSLTGFLFGNIDMKTGQLEDDILDPESKRQLSALQKLGLATMMSDVMEGEEAEGGVDKKKKKSPEKPVRRIITSYDSSDSDEEEEEEEEDGSNNLKDGFQSGTLSSQTGQDDDDDYDEAKSPSAVDFSDISELAEEDPSSLQLVLRSAIISRDDDDDDTDYDTDSRLPVPSHVRRLFNESDDKSLMPPPVSTHIKKVTTPVQLSENNELVLYSEENDSSIMCRDSTPEKEESGKSSDKRLETPLAAMMPSKYAGVDVSEIFPDFRTGKVLRFARLFGPGKPSSLPQIWKNVKRRRRKRKILSEGLSAADLAEKRERRGWEFFFGLDVSDSDADSDEGGEFHDDDDMGSDDDSCGRGDRGEGSWTLGHANIWRHGPAELWYDMLNVPEDGEHFDYGFQIQAKKSKVQDSSSDEDQEMDSRQRNTNATEPAAYSDETFHMVTQRDWESDIIWDGNDTKYKKTTKNKAAGWVPSGVNRTAQTFSPQSKNSPGPSSTASSSTSKKDGSKDTSSSGGSMSKAAAKAAALALIKNAEEGGQVDDTWYSIFPVETSELVYGRWEDEVIWDVEEMDHIPQPKILALDPNDENVVLCIPDDIDPNAAQGAIVPVKVKIPHPHVKKSKILLGKAGVINVIEEDSPPPSPKNDDKDPYNISNDEYYQPKYTEQSMLKISAAGNIIQHSTPVVELRAPFIPTHMPFSTLRAFHRPAMKYVSKGMFSNPGPHPILPLTKHIKKKAKQREQERLAAGGGDIFFMRTPDDLTGKDGELIMIEYCEEHPPLLSQVGMCSKIKNYYKRIAGKDEGPPNYKYGETAYAHSSPFLGVMQSGQSIQTLENNMYRAPIYPHPLPFCDFLVIRTKNNYFIREVDGLFTAGQECPLYEVPGPNSKRANNFVRDFLQVFIYRLFWKSRDTPRRIRMDEIKKAFPMHSESSIRKRLKLCADFKRTGVDSNWWVVKPDFRLTTEEEIRAMVSPEQCCAYFSLTSAEQRLKDAGYGEKFLFAPQDDDEDDNQNKIDDEVKTAPWNTTRAYIQAMKGKCLLQLTGPADPTGCGEGFSYVRVPNKPQTNKEEQEAQPKRIVTGTDADLRRLSLNNAKALLRKFGVPEEEIKKLSRWEVIDVVRTLSTEKAKAGEKGMTKFSRGNRFSVAEHQERYKEECQRIFELQHRILSSSEVLSTDEGESSGSELSDIEEMGKNIENIISNKKTNSQVNQEKEEQERRELQKMIMGETSASGGKDDDDKSPRKKKKEEEENQTLSGLVNHPGRVLKIHRTFKSQDGKEYTRTEIVRKAAIIDIYMRIRTTKDENFIRQFALLDDQAKEEMKKEKRRIQEQLRRIKRNQEKDTNKPAPPPRKKKIKLKPDLKMKCGACGQVGHMRTNKACPLYNATSSSPIPSMNVAMTQDEEDEIEKHLTFEDEELVRVDGTKVQLSGKVVKHVEDMKRRSLLIKVPKDAMSSSGRKKKKRTAQAPHCDYLSKKGKTTNRRRIDPMVVIGGIFESILSELRDLPDSSQFHYPVSTKTFPDYSDRVQKPMDLQTIRENIRQKKYQTTSDFLADVTLIYENSVAYNGQKNLITEYAYNLLTLCKKRLKEKSDQLDQLERMINPLLDNDQTGLAYILEQCLNKVRTTQEAFPFLKPVNKKAVKDYYDIIKNPMDLESMEKKNKANKYQNRNQFLTDLSVIYTNAIQYNGRESVFAIKASQLTGIAADFFKLFEEQLSTLEGNIEKSRINMLEEFGEVDVSNMDFGDSQDQHDQEGDPSDSDDEDMELVEVPNASYDEDEELRHMEVAQVLAGQLGESPDSPENNMNVQLDNYGLNMGEEHEAGMHRMGFGDHRGGHIMDPNSSMEDENQEAAEAILMIGGHQGIRRAGLAGAETPRNIHEDLEVSESEDEDSDFIELSGSRGNEEASDHRQHQQHQQQEEEGPQDDDGLWF